MILIMAIKLMILLAYQGSQMFGVFIINALVDAIFDRLENWSVKRAEPEIIIVQGA
tara:strand:- start:206 stop:373 length:168 start_codon:yes stop_codon:yes gene_type:complete